MPVTVCEVKVVVVLVIRDVVVVVVKSPTVDSPVRLVVVKVLIVHVYGPVQEYVVVVSETGILVVTFVNVVSVTLVETEVLVVSNPVTIATSR